MNLNAHAIVTLCSHMCVGEGVVPLEPKEWSELAKLLMEKQLQPADLLGFSEAEMKERLQLATDQTQRLARLVDRSASLSFELSQYENMGIFVITRADEQYPKRLKKVLGNQCPPLFYYAGNLELLDCRSVGYAGSRSVGEEDIAFTKQTVRKTVQQGYGVVSGGAKGIDSIAENEALSCGSRRPLLPVTMPSAAAQRMASCAQPAMSAASEKPSKLTPGVSAFCCSPA